MKLTTQLCLLAALAIFAVACGDSSSTPLEGCQAVCAHQTQLCGSSPNCATICATVYTEADRTCVLNATECGQVDACFGQQDAGVNPDSGGSDGSSGDAGVGDTAAGDTAAGDTAAGDS